LPNLASHQTADRVILGGRGVNVRWRSIDDEKPPEGSPVLGILEAKK